MSNQKKFMHMKTSHLLTFPPSCYEKKTKTFPNIGTCHALKFVLRYWEYTFKLIIMFKKERKVGKLGAMLPHSLHLEK
jgi:hypothetical protein